MSKDSIEKMSGHWVLAKVGKKVLRPGGKQMTDKMIKLLDINSTDHVVEFAPGLGYTANITLQKNPKTYIGIDLEEAIVKDLNLKFGNEKTTFKLANAAQTELDNESQTKVYGEAMLTMHADHRKSEIIQEAFRILKNQGIYAIHELALKPDLISEEIKKEIQRELAETMKVNARPLTIEEWKNRLINEGFEIITIETAEMHLLEPSRLIDDEGFNGFMTIVKNIATQPEIRERVIKMKKIFKKYEEHLCATVIMAKKTT
ncbi:MULTISPECIES: methyltransferase domain-containing protein [unclassified Empedobacter]|uniref:methyltransferase domain-containing protein n=1 Tax=unclassified Empedobacter TaxID=2643773 RepID=UPI00244C04D2|nr:MULTISPECIES: methyltransferase domain-containing protein [unclassified Empedobacter]MDH0674408.1 methyltransferase domain-containing protein [Empedobacter sp. GD03861]